MSQLPPEVHRLIDSALSEDQTFNDPTTQALVPPEIIGVGMIRAKAHGVLAGVDVAAAVFQRVDAGLAMSALLEDGSILAPGDDIAAVEGSAASILRAERIALNFLQRMSGIASETNRYVQAIQGCTSRIVDTRKTVPGLRYLDKYAVRMGGGYNHRLNLADGILIKDNQNLKNKQSLQSNLKRSKRNLQKRVNQSLKKLPKKRLLKKPTSKKKRKQKQRNPNSTALKLVVKS